MFSNAVKLFSINGFDIKIDPSWLIIASLVTWSLSQQYFPSVLANESSATYWAMAVLGMLGFFGSLLLHELGHSIVARYLGVPIKSITLFIFGGMAELGKEPSSALDEFWIALAGPVTSLALALGFWTIAQGAWLTSGSAALFEVASYLALVNLVLAIFNMLPAFPMDGGRVLRAYLWHKHGDVLAATRIAARSGMFFGYLLMGLGVFALFQGLFVTGMWQLMIGGFVLIAARSSYTSQLAQKVFEDKNVGALMASDPVTVGPEVTLSEFINQVMLRHRVSYVPVIDDGVLLGHIDQSVISGIEREHWANTRVGDVFVGLEQSTLVAPDMPVLELLDLISKTGQRKFLVVSDHQLCGVITLADLTLFLGRNEPSKHKPEP
jgi:Zn-dependent protease/CBS domain-containing protein